MLLKVREDKTLVKMLLYNSLHEWYCQNFWVLWKNSLILGPSIRYVGH